MEHPAVACTDEAEKRTARFRGHISFRRASVLQVSYAAAVTKATPTNPAPEWMERPGVISA